MQGPGAVGMAEAATVHMEFLEEGASDRDLATAAAAAATHDGGREAGANNGWMATAATMVANVLREAVEENVKMKVEVVVVVGSYGRNRWVESMAAEEEGRKMKIEPVVGEMVEVMSKKAVEALSKRAREVSKRAAMAEGTR